MSSPYPPFTMELRFLTVLCGPKPTTYLVVSRPDARLCLCPDQHGVQANVPQEARTPSPESW